MLGCAGICWDLQGLLEFSRKGWNVMKYLFARIAGTYCWALSGIAEMDVPGFVGVC